MRKTYKYKIEPTATQEQHLGQWLGTCRFLYNCALEHRITAWKYHRVTITRFQQEAELKDIRAEMPWIAEVHSHPLQDVLARLEKAYQAFFRRVKAGAKAGFPRFQGKNRFHSFTFKEYGNGARCDNGFLVLSKIGRVKVLWSRPLEGTPKTVTISQEADGWYVSFSCADVPCVPLPKTGNETGIDMGLSAFYTDSQGQKIVYPQFYRKAEQHLQKAHRKVSRRKKGSKRRKKAVHKLQMAYLTVTRQREDFHHKTALKLVRENDVIYHEDLQIANMVKNRHLAKSISDAAWGTFLTILSFKAAYAGREVVAVPAQYTSQDCSNVVNGEHCGERVKKSLSVRTHVCPKCGYIADRDHNAAGEIQWRGQRLRGLAGLPAGVNRASAGL